MRFGGQFYKEHLSDLMAINVYEKNKTGIETHCQIMIKWQPLLAVNISICQKSVKVFCENQLANRIYNKEHFIFNSCEFCVTHISKMYSKFMDAYTWVGKSRFTSVIHINNTRLIIQE